MVNTGTLDISVVIPTLDAGATLSATLEMLGGVEEIIVVDGGSRDGTQDVAIRHGARFVRAAKGRGYQLAAGADLARSEWLLFLHADTHLEPGWKSAVTDFIASPPNKEKAAAFSFTLDDMSPQARRLEWIVALRTRTLGLPYGDQGLLIHRDLYTAVGGYPAWELMEDVDLVRRIGRKRLVILAIAANTSAFRWKQEGWFTRSARNLFCLSLYYLNVPPRLIARIYGSS
ncbi:TIGR04283 family arsenosugar biosynthesis glycosyltransferase [Hyphomicrobium sp.]|uniref:TIGR04283 family arsenosugar biosynthesis glycosyltransferase n=1 Tax=Hyphomicrobium sp. TaxID=82 RepID=UPI0025C6F639|nr:TIGR04283 family arsenosugar biosynthesis glycosyltransferase [Hyphomicrobium sp.]